MRKLLQVLLLTALSFPSFGQQARVSGIVADSLGNNPLDGVNVFLQEAQDTARWHLTVTDSTGVFEFTDISTGDYVLNLSHTGYVRHRRVLFAKSGHTNLGTFQMGQAVTTLTTVIIEGNVIPVEQKGDTIQYNANAFDTNPDATAEELIAKMPGIDIDETGINAQGDNVVQILVDGQPFFGDDPYMALRNLPAHIIGKVEIFDQLSEQSQFTGFDDGQTRKTLNIVTKGGIRHSRFGKINSSLAENGRYLAGGDINSFNGHRRVSLIGNTNTLSQQNFGRENMTGPGNVRMSGQQAGISTSHSAGVNYSNRGKRMEFAGSYFFNASDNERETDLSRTYFARDGGMTYLEKSNTSRSHNNHRMHFRLKYNIDSMNSLVITPAISMQVSNSLAFTGSHSSILKTPVSILDNMNSTNNTGYNFGTNILFQHRFRKRGRFFSWNLSTGINDRDGESRLESSNEHPDQNQVTKISQSSTQLITSHAASSNISATEAVGKHGQLQLNYSTSFSTGVSDKKTYDLDTETEEFLNINTSLTNVFKNKDITNRVGLSYRYNVIRKFGLMAAIRLQHAKLLSDEAFPERMEIERSFRNILPEVSFNYQFSRNEHFRIFYRAATQPPSISQLQNVVDNTNPLFLRSGNANLKQNYQQSLNLLYAWANIENGRNLHVSLLGRYTQHPIGNARFFNGSADSTVVNQIGLAPGQQLTYPFNAPENWNAHSSFSYGLPLKLIKSNLNFSSGFNYNRSPALVNYENNVAHNYSISQSVKVSSNISKNVDFRFSNAVYYTIVKNSLTKDQRAQNNYFRNTSVFHLNCQPWKGLVVNSTLTGSTFSGLSSEYNQGIWFWTAAIGYKFFKKKSLEAKVNAIDLLNQNKSIDREVSDTYIEDSQTNVPTRFFMLSVTYRFSKINSDM